jgi:hypothetical protein
MKAAVLLGWGVLLALMMVADRPTSSSVVVPPTASFELPPAPGTYPVAAQSAGDVSITYDWLDHPCPPCTTQNPVCFDWFSQWFEWARLHPGPHTC